MSLSSIFDGGSQTQELSRVGGLITDGAISPDGSRYVLRDYVDARIFSGPPPGEELQRITLPAQPQGEAITWSADGNALLIASEGDDRLLRVEIPSPAISASAAPTTAAPTTAAPTTGAPPTELVQAAQTNESLSPGALVALVVLALAALSALLLFAERARRRDGTAE